MQLENEMFTDPTNVIGDRNTNRWLPALSVPRTLPGNGLGAMQCKILHHLIYYGALVGVNQYFSKCVPKQSQLHESWETDHFADGVNLITVFSVVLWTEYFWRESSRLSFDPSSLIVPSGQGHAVEDIPDVGIEPSAPPLPAVDSREPSWASFLGHLYLSS